MPRSGSGSSRARSSSAVDDRVDVAGLVAAGVADGLLARGVGPAGAVGDHVGVVAAEQPADDLAQRVELVVGGVGQRGADVVAEPEVAGGRLGVAGALGGAALAVVLGGVAQVLVVEAGAGEVALLAGGRRCRRRSSCWRTVSSMKTRVDDPDAGGEVRAAVGTSRRSGRWRRGRAARRRRAA